MKPSGQVLPEGKLGKLRRLNYATISEERVIALRGLGGITRIQGKQTQRGGVADTAPRRTTSSQDASVSTLVPLSSLRWSTFCAALASTVKGACQWGLLIALAKIGHPEMLGQYAFGLAICIPVFMITDLQLRLVQATDARDDYRFGHYLALRALTTPLAVLVVTGYSWGLGYRGDATLIIAAIALSRATESMSDCIHGALQKDERLDLVSFSIIIRNLCSLVIFVCVLLLSGLLLPAVLSQVAIGLVIFFACDWPWASKIRGRGAIDLAPSFEWEKLWKLIVLALPLGLVVMFISLNANVPRYFLAHHFGNVPVGIFAALIQPTLAGGMAMAAIGHATMPRMARSFATRNTSYLIRMVLRLSLLGAFLGAVMLVITTMWGKQILVWFYRPGYAEYQDTFFWLMVAGAISYVSSALGYGLNATRAYHGYMIFYASSAILGGILGIYLIPSFGLKGAAWTVCSTNLVSALFLGGLLFTLIQKVKADDQT